MPDLIIVKDAEGNTFKMTKEQAEARGFTPVKKSRTAAEAPAAEAPAAEAPAPEAVGVKVAEADNKRRTTGR